MSSLRPLTPFLQQVAIDELNEDPKRIEEDLQILKTWIEQQPHLRACTDDQFLIAFLRGCKYRFEKAKSKIDKYYTLRTRFPHIFTIKDVEETLMREILQIGVGVILPTPLNETGPRILFFRQGIYDPKKYSIQDMMRVTDLIRQIQMLEDDYAVVNGMIYVVDLSKLTTDHMLQMTPSVMKSSSVWNEEAIPIRNKATHIMNAPKAFEAIFNLFKSMVSEKQANRLFVYGNDWTKLYEKIPQKYLPKEYGGENGSIPELIKMWEEKVFTYRDYFLQDLIKYGTDENLRPGKPINFDNLFGMEGSFRQLNVD